MLTQEKPGRRVLTTPTLEVEPLREGPVQEVGEMLAEPWERSVASWRTLEVRSVYARRVRPLFLGLLACLAFPLAVLLLVPLVGVNAILHRGLRRAFFLQDRVGHRGRVFRVVKLRTMRDGGEGDETRVTRFGRFLRNAHLDELPQLWNVVRGDMSLIGPRPEMLSIERWASRHRAAFSERLALKPGITGLAQITQGYARNGDGRAYGRKLALNRLYRRRMSFRQDLGILFATVLWMLRRRGWRWQGGSGTS